MDPSRRNLMVGGAAAGASLLAYGSLSGLFQRGRAGERKATTDGATPSSQGGLVRHDDGILAIAPGFTYQVVERAGGRMDDGYRVPALPDGMACFDAGDGEHLVLLRNHEVDRRPDLGAGPTLPPEAFDARAHGGVTRLVVDRASGARVSSNLVLAGTLRNCAGGPSPWGWLTCEETTVAGHGYVFATNPKARKVERPRRIPGYGRFNHEAVAIDPTTHAAYLTEDRGDGCLYRFAPSSKDRPWDGELQAMAVVGRPRLDTATSLQPGEVVDVEWVPIPDPDPARDSVRHQGRQAGAAVVRRGEGIAYHDGVVYFTSTSGGPKSRGQVFRLTPGRGQRRDRVELVAQATEENDLDMPDNLTVAPWGDVYLCEDGPGGNHLRVLRKDGRLVDLAKNIRSPGELAGVCFSPAGDTLFVNLQIDGLTIAIRGPFRKLGA